MSNGYNGDEREEKKKGGAVHSRFSVKIFLNSGRSAGIKIVGRTIAPPENPPSLSQPNIPTPLLAIRISFLSILLFASSLLLHQFFLSIDIGIAPRTTHPLYKYHERRVILSFSPSCPSLPYHD
jgi:hypothetical protein